MSLTTSTYKLADNVAWRIVDGEVFAITIDGTLHNITNETGKAIWDRLADGPVSVDALAEALVDEFEVDLVTATADATEFLALLVEKGVAVVV